MLPVVLQDLPANVVMVKHPESGEVRFVIMSALLFGFSASVMQFARWSRFLEAMMRRVLCLLWAMCVNDSNVVDFADGKGSAQWLGRRVLLAIGVPLAEHKKILMSPRSTLLGMLHDLGRALSQGSVHLLPGMLSRKSCGSSSVHVTSKQHLHKQTRSWELPVSLL